MIIGTKLIYLPSRNFIAIGPNDVMQTCLDKIFYVLHVYFHT